MKNIFIYFLLFSSYSFADDLNMTVNNLNFTYQNPHGTGNAAEIIQDGRVWNNVQVKVDKFNNDFKFIIEGHELEEFELTNAPSLMTEAEIMSISGLNLNLKDRISLNVVSANFQSPQDKLKFDRLFFDCSRDLTQENFQDQFISGCIKNLSFKTSRFSSQLDETSLITNFIALFNEENAKAATRVIVESVNLKINNGKYEFSADVKAQVSGKVQSNGSISYDQPAKKLTLKISEVKFGYLSITEKVFEELKKQESDQLKVNRPYVYYTVK